MNNDPAGKAEKQTSNPSPSELQAGKPGPVARSTANQGGDKETQPLGGEPSLALPQIRNYDILSELGRGGMGVVYRARQESLNRDVALKMILAGEYASEQSRRRFLREAEAIACLQHPHIIQVFELGECNGHPFFVMELVEGQDLSAVRNLDPSQVAEIVQKIAVGVDYAHGRGIIHRDLKPANILLDANGEPKITDFGLAKISDTAESLHLTGREQLLGTAAYMSPEQAAGDARDVTPASDVYALGAILYQLLTDQPPFMGKSTLDVLRKVQHVAPFAPGRLADHIPKDLETICLRCLEKAPEKRFASAAELAEELGRYRNGLPIRSRRVNPVTRTWRWARRTPAAMLVGLLLLTACALAAWNWRNYVLDERPTIRHFRTHHLVNGEWVGVGPLDDDLVAKRGSSLAFETRGSRGPTTRITSVNGHGEPVISTLLSSVFDAGPFDQAKYTVVAVELERNANDAITKLVAKDRTDQTVWSFVFTNYPTTGHFVDARGVERTRQKSGAAYIEFSYTEIGFLQETRYLDVTSRPKPGPDGAYGQRVLEWEHGLATLTCSIDATGQPMVANGHVYHRYEYTPDGTLQQLDCLDADRRLAYCSYGYASTQWQHDSHGNTIGQCFLDTEGQLTVCPQGYARLQRDLGVNGQVLAERYFGPDGNPVAVSPHGAAGLKYVYNKQGQFASVAYFNEQQEPCLVVEGYHRAVSSYDQRGNIAGRSYFDIDGNPALNTQGIHEQKFAFDEAGRNTSTSYFNVLGEPTTQHENWHRLDYGYDAVGNLNRRTYWDADANPTLHRDGYHQWDGEFDYRGNLTAETFRDAAGKLVVVGGDRDFAIASYKYNDRGDVQQIRVYDENHAPILNRHGWHRMETVYDSNGFVSELMYFDELDAPTWHKDGYFRTLTRRDEQGNAVETSYFDPSEKPTVTRLGYARTTAKYDVQGRLVEQSFFDAKGVPALDADHGAATMRYAFDRRGNVTLSTKLDPQGRPFAAIRSTYSPRGNLLELATTDGRGSLVEVDGIAKKVSTYDARGRRISLCYFNRDGARIRYKADGVSKIVNTYDRQGNLIAEEVFDELDRPTATLSGHSIVKRKFDLFGNAIEVAYFDTQGAPFLSPKLGYSMFRAVYDRHGQVVERAYFDADGKPVLHEGIHHVTQMKYERGLVVEEKFLGTERQPILTPDGFHRIEYEYDERGHRKEKRYLGLDGTLTKSLAWAREQTEYDARGNLIQVSWFHASGAAVDDGSGYATKKLYYDALGREIAQELFDGDGNRATGTAEECWRIERREDIHGTQVLLRFLDTEGRPIKTSSGFAEYSVETDQFGQPTRTNYFDATGTQIAAKVKVIDVVADSVAEELGLQPGDVFTRLDGILLTDVTMFFYRRTQASSAGELLISRGEETVSVTLPLGPLGVQLADTFAEP